MADRLYRTQILLKPEQHAELAQIAKQEGRSISDVVREMIDNELERRKNAANTDIQRRLAALDRIQQHRAEILARRGGKPIDIDVVELINQMRDERDAEIAGVLSNVGN